MKLKLLLTISILTIYNYYLYSQELGSPIITNYTSEEYNAHSQNWAIVQDNRGVMYFGNTECVIEYDGTYWKKINASNGTMIRSLALGKDSVVYVGAVGDFGYLASDSIGNTIFCSLTEDLDSIDKEFNDVWETVSTNSGIYFRSMKKLFRYNLENDELKIWTAKDKKYFNPSFSMPSLENDYIFRLEVQYQNMVKNEIVALPESQIMKDYFIYKLLPFSKTQFICITFNQLFLFDITKKDSEPASTFSEKYTEEFSDANLYMGSKINENLFVINSRNKGIYTFTKNGDISEHITEKSNLQDNFVWTSFFSKDSILWLGMNNGLSSIEINSPFRIWDKNTGFAESINGMIRFNGILYFATMNGLFYLQKTEKNYEQNEINQILGTKNELWKFVSFYDETQKKQRLLAASTSYLIEILENKIVDLKTITYFYNFAQSLINKNVFNCLSINNFEAISIEGDKITTLGTIALSGVLKYYAEEKNGTIWVGSTNNGIYKLEIDKENKIDTSKYSKTGIFLKTKVTLYDSLKGLPDMQRIRPYIIDNKLFVGTTKGLYQYNNEKDIFEKDTLINNKFKNPNLPISDLNIDYLGNIYLISNVNLFYLHKIKSFNYEIDSTIFKRLEKYNKSIIYAQDSNNVWFAGVNLLINYNPNLKYDIPLNFNTLIRKVTLSNDSMIFNGNYYSTKLSKGYKFDLIQPKNLIPTLDYNYNSLVFHYSSPYFISSESIKYSYKLEGYENEWSIWTTETKKEYTNLDEGNYIFKVKAQNIYQQESTVAQYIFRINPPWYRTVLAYFLYIILSVLLIIIVVKIYSHRLINEKIKLEKIVFERTKEISVKNIELENQKEEILVQSKELEKLSIVASETDNAIIITDKYGNFEWLNKGFTRLYGYNFEEFVAKSNNLLKATSNNNLKDLFYLCINNKKSVSYESFMITKTDEKIWAQSTITPILNIDNEIIKLIIIDTDISKLKKAEQEILQKNEEIMAQKEALEQQNEEISAQRDELEDKNVQINIQNEMIKGSIRYAQTIQLAILPDLKIIKKYFDYFILFKPKDIVSGDFYWFNKFADNYYFAVVDCTGHGVPGAFMSMIGSRILNEIVIKNNNISPAEILAALSENIVIALRQNETENKDGMDVCLVKIENYSDNYKKVNFCGAKRELIYYNIENKEIKRIKGDRKTIGGVYEKRNIVEFTNTEIILQQNSVLYLSSDGYIDQNNMERKRMGTTKLIQILTENCEKPLIEQKYALENNLEIWQSGVEQRDDITILGIKI